MQTSGNGSVAVRWDLGPIYPGFDSSEYQSHKKRLETLSAEYVEAARRGSGTGADEAWLERCIDLHNETGDLQEQLEEYAYACFSTDTNDSAAAKEINRLEEIALPRAQAVVELRNALSDNFSHLADGTPKSEGLRRHLFFIREQLSLQKHQMTPDQEDLAADLSRSGGDAWSRLHESVSSNLTCEWDPATGEKKTVNDLRALAFSADRNARERAYHLELDAWEQAKTPLSFAINGVKGFSTSLNARRGYETAVEHSLVTSRMTRNALNALITVMKESLPLFRRYLKAKAAILGLPVLRFYDLFAPVDSEADEWGLERARDFIVEQFSGFSEALGVFAQRAFKNSWIDAERRKGKVGGAYCVSFPLAGESRILCNYDGSFSAVSTIAHELGHAYHHHVLKDATHDHRNYPMTLAETASIFCQTIVFNAALERAETGRRVGIIEEFLQDATQVIVDILSRYLFETALFERRRDAELTPDELSNLMLDAQRETYGNGLDPDYLHPFMWAVKGHYYRQDLPFYNYPYAFGLLFGLGLYDRYRSEGDAFVPAYDEILRNTGRQSAVEVALSAGFDIEDPEFWRSGINVIREHVSTYEQLIS